MSTTRILSLAGGELAPALQSRVDLSKYQTGLKTMRNTFVQKSGGSANRPGTQFVGEAGQASTATRLIEFIFNNDQSYILSFEDQKIRFIQDGAYITEGVINVTGAGITQDPQCDVTAGSHGYLTGDLVIMTGVVGMTELNGRYFIVDKVNANRFKLKTANGVYIDSTGFGAWVSGGTIHRVYTLASPYLAADLFKLQYAQNADVMTIAHTNYSPRELARLGATNWTLSTIAIEPDAGVPTLVAANYRTTGRTTNTSSTLGELIKTNNLNVGMHVTGSGIPANTTIAAITDATTVDLSNTATISAQGVAITFTAKTGSNSYYYLVTSVDQDSREESLAGYSSSVLRFVDSVQNTSPVKVAMTAIHGYSTGDWVRISGTLSPEVNDREFQITVTSSTEYTLNDLFTATAAATGGSAIRISALASAVAAPTPTEQIPISWSSLNFNGTRGQENNVYRLQNGVFGFIGVAHGTDFSDIGYTPDTTGTPPLPRNPINAGPAFYPATVAYLQQRLVFAGSNADPETVNASRIGKYHNFSTSSPLQDDDAVTFTMASRRVNQVKHLIDIGRALVFTTAGEWMIQGDSAGALTPSQVNLKQLSYNGSGDLSPLVANGNALYVQARGSIVRDLSYDYRVDSYNGNDLTVFASHLFEGHTIVDWAYQQVPHSIIWAVRSDGTLLGLTYLREHEIWAWHRHDFDGALIESVAVVPEGNEDVLYAVLLRTDSVGNDVRYIERLSSRSVLDIVDSVFMDSAITYDGRNTDETVEMALAAGTAGGSPIVLTCTQSYFSTSDVGTQFQLTSPTGDVVRFTVTGYTSATQVTGHPNRTVPDSFAFATFSTWARMISTVQNLWHLEQRQISVLGDGFVVASPNNPSIQSVTVVNGQAVLDRAYAVVHAGIPYTSDLETLDIDSAQGETLSDKKKLISAVTLHLEKTRGVFVGPKPPVDDSADALQNLYEMKIRQYEGYDEPTDLLTGVATINIRPEWNSNGRVFIRQVDPLPISVLSISPAGVIIQGGQ